MAWVRVRRRPPTLPACPVPAFKQVAREVCFLESGQIEVRETPPFSLHPGHGRQPTAAPLLSCLLQVLDEEEESSACRTVRPEEAFYPPIGELAFFLAIPQPFTFCGAYSRQVH